MAGDLPHGLRLIVAYDGTEFAGWQAQPGQRTVQGVLEAAVGAVAERRSRILAASRTDAGVHALGQVAAFACDRALPPTAWVHELNVNLPDDVRVVHVDACAPDYDPRHDAAGKRYRYLFRVGPIRDPVTRHRAWHVGPPLARREPPRTPFPAATDYLDVGAMERAAARLVGTHDFRAFQASNDYREQTVRTLHEVRVVADPGGQPELLVVEVTGNAFLKNMVRILAGTLLEAGRGRLSPDDVPKLLGPAAKRADAGPTAPAHGLTLMRVLLGRASERSGEPGDHV